MHEGTLLHKGSNMQEDGFARSVTFARRYILHEDTFSWRQ